MRRNNGIGRVVIMGLGNYSWRLRSTLWSILGAMGGFCCRGVLKKGPIAASINQNSTSHEPNYFHLLHQPHP